MDKKDRKTLGMIAMTHSLVHLIEGAIPPLLPLLRVVFGANYFQMGIVMTVFSYSFGLGAFPAGLLADKIGPKKLLVAYLFGSGVLCILVFPIKTLLSFGVLLGVLGLFGSLYHPAANTLISLGIKQRGKAFGINGIAGSLGTASVPFLAAFLGARLGWKSPFLIFGFVALLLGVYALIVPATVMDHSEPTGPATEKTERTEKKGFLVLFLFYASCALSGMGNRGVLSFLPTFLGKSLFADILAADRVTLGGLVASATLVIGASGQYIAGHLVDKHRPIFLYISTLVITAISIVTMATFGGPFIFIGAAGFGFFSFAIQPLQNTMVSQLITRRRHGLGFGIMFFMTFGVGSLAAAISGYMADRFGLSSLFYVMAGCYTLSCVCLFGILALERQAALTRG
jgi:MFS family permease